MVNRSGYLGGVPEALARRMRVAALLRAALVVAAMLLVNAFTLAGLAVTARAETAPSEPVRLAGLVTPNDMNMGALLLPSKEPGLYVEAPRLKTDVAITVTGPIIRTVVTQRFENPADGWVEGIYVFPLPEGAAVDRLKMRIGDRFIEGRIKPREEARQIYEEAKAEGKKAALLEQQRPNIFTNAVANIGPKETVVVQIEYQDTVRQDAGTFSLRFPMVVAPRYNPRPVVQTVQFGTGDGGQSGWTVSDPVPDREQITPPVLDPRENAKINPVSLKVHLAAGFPLQDVESSFHDIERATVDGGTMEIALKTDSVPADKDFELTWTATPGSTPTAGLFRETRDDGEYLLAYITPPSVTQPAGDRPLTREIVYVIDNSGSMGGESIRQAKESLLFALRRLTPADRFNVIRFDDTMTDVFGQIVPANAENVGRAIAFVSALEAEGGTEMLPALNAALLNQGPIQADLRQVVFLTDGAIGNEAQLFESIASNRGAARVFTVGIGSAPNSYFMTRAAELGRGTFTHIGSETQVQERMQDLFAKLESPAATNLSLSVEGAQASDITPDPLPDLYAGEPLVLTAKLPPETMGKLTLTGQTGRQPWRVEMDTADAAKGTGIGTLWARRKIGSLEASTYLAPDPSAIDRQIEQVAMAHHIVSRMTSLVAVDTEVSRPAGETVTTVDMPTNLPDGWDPALFFDEQQPQAPQPDDLREAGVDRSIEVASLVASAATPEAAAIVARDHQAVALPATGTASTLLAVGGLLLLAASAILAWFTGLWRGFAPAPARTDRRRRR